MAFYDSLKRLRIAKGFTIQQTADALGLPRNTYKCWELGTRQPSIEALCRIADYYHVTVDVVVDHMLTSEEQDLLNRYFALPADKRDGLISGIMALLNNPTGTE